MIYCTYPEYQAAGGAVSEAAFGVLCKRASRLIDRITMGRAERHCAACESCRASIALGETTAKAVQLIPDAHCNGDMHAALDYATKVKHKQRDFVAKRGIESLVN